MPNSPRSRNFSRYPMLWIAIYFACGIALGHTIAFPFFISGATVALFLAGCVIRRDAIFFLLPIVFVPLGAVCYQVESEFISADRIKLVYSDGRINSGEPAELEGVLLGPPEPAYGGMFLNFGAERLVFKNTEQTVSGNARFFAPVNDDEAADEYRQLDLRYGSRLRVMCNLTREERFRNPGVASRIEMLDQQGIDATGTIKSPLLIEKIGDEPVFRPLAWIYERRQILITAFREDFSAPTAGVLAASLLGDKHFLDRQTADVFRDGGTFHVLVISGLHITFIGGVLLWLLSFLTLRRLWQYLLAIGFLWAYTLAVGAEVPVVRASLMFSFLLFSRLIYRTGTLLNAFGTCGLFLLIWRPSDLFSASFQLTIVSVGAILACAFPFIEKMRAIGGWTPTVETPLPANISTPLRRFCELLYWNETAWRIENNRQIWSANLFKSPYVKLLNVPNIQSAAAYVFEGVLVSLIVQISMLPLLVIYFHRISPAAVLLNLWVGAFLALESFAAVGAVLVNSFSGWLSAPLIVLTEFLNTSMMLVPTWFSEGGVASFRLPVYSGPWRVIYFVYGISVATAAASIFKWDPFALNKARGRSRLAIASIALTCFLGLTLILHPFSQPAPDGRLRIDFLDVGQGDSALVTFPNGETMLIDGGGQVSYGGQEASEFEPDVPRIGESVVSEFLWEKGYSQIDYLMMTHADADHAQGLIDVAENFDIGSVLLGPTPPDDPEFAGLLRVIDRRAIPMTIVGAGDELAIGETQLYVLNPTNDELSRSESANNGSVVILSSFGQRSFLLTGDIERDAEKKLVENNLRNLAADVVKVPHHGSRTSSTDEFVKATGADLAVISVGRRSRFGHPHREVVERWQNSGAEIMTTGERGTITVSTNGTDLQIRTFVP
jgi:competence protein ComEC